MSEFSFEQAIGAMLQDPEQMQKIFALAQSLGFSPPHSKRLPHRPSRRFLRHLHQGRMLCRRMPGSRRSVSFCRRRGRSTAGRKTF